MRLTRHPFVVALLLAIAAPVPAPAADGPAPRSALAAAMSAPKAGRIDDAARQRLVGTHLMTLQWIGWGDLAKAGTVTVKPDGKALAISGEQRGTGDASGDYTRITGRIVSADAKSFVFDGEIVTRVASNGDGSECRRSGTMHFLATGTRRYWRLQEMKSPCSEVTDYVDVYFLDVRAAAS